jgi:hypothetical protein
MAKQPETIDRIEIIALAPLELVGVGLAALTKLGFENVGFRVITDVLKFKQRTTHETSAMDLGLAFVKKNARFTRGQLADHFAKAGRAPTNAYYVISKLHENNIVAKSGNEYVRVEALMAPAKKQKQKKRMPTQRYEVGNEELITNLIKGREQFTSRELIELLVKKGRSGKSVSPILWKMAKNKKIKANGAGTYTVMNGAANG